MLDALKQIEAIMKQCIDNRGYVDGHHDGDQTMSDLVLMLSERLYDDEKACVERIRKAYAEARERWYYE